MLFTPRAEKSNPGAPGRYSNDAEATSVAVATARAILVDGLELTPEQLCRAREVLTAAQSDLSTACRLVHTGHGYLERGRADAAGARPIWTRAPETESLDGLMQEADAWMKQAERDLMVALGTVGALEYEVKWQDRWRGHGNR